MAPASLGSKDGGDKSGTREGMAGGPGSLGADGGGGGGGYSAGNSGGGGGDVAPFDPNHIPKWGDKEKPLLKAEPVAGSGLSDRSQPHGPSIFYIADQAHGSFCRKHSLTKACAK
jgi:hypothetical protein